MKAYECAEKLADYKQIITNQEEKSKWGKVSKTLKMNSKRKLNANIKARVRVGQ